MSDTSTRYVKAATWHRLSDGAANIAYALCIAVLALTPIISVAAMTRNGVMFGAEVGFVFAGAATGAALYFLGVSFVLAQFQNNGLPLIK